MSAGPSDWKILARWACGGAFWRLSVREDHGITQLRVAKAWSRAFDNPTPVRRVEL